LSRICRSDAGTVRRNDGQQQMRGVARVAEDLVRGHAPARQVVAVGRQ
jgi:hypothetical protein